MINDRLPKVSIIMPCFNAEAYVAQAISSCLDQDYPNIEVIVVNDGSTDGSKAIIDGFGDQIVALHLPNGGAPKARNIGIAASGGDYIKLLDADDLLEDGCIRKQVDLTYKLSENHIGFGYLKEIDASNRLIQINRHEHIGKLADLVFLMMRGVLISQPLYPKAALLSASGFDERLKARQEWNLHIRLHLQGYSFEGCDVCCFQQRNHDSPYRITNRSRAASNELDIISMSLDPLKGNVDPDVQSLMALMFWNYGRRYAITDPEAANLFFDAAKLYDPHRRFKFHRKVYVTALKCSNPKTAEILMQLLKLAKRSLKKSRT